MFCSSWSKAGGEVNVFLPLISRTHEVSRPEKVATASSGERRRRCFVRALPSIPAVDAIYGDFAFILLTSTA